ncbi:prenyltransferase/squalene oxidase repeat-containing protein [Streptomyces pseudovenezuelae]|uniref:Terpene cyclase/mutase family protein n=1 Tax=Streptomyces pseudovenezuelae TaxID=67350 RepID=A0ABZ1X985_9ACTN|nr:prenyltransferase/squalene oxidase repeat-containing protein [Streptomyces pseudovenezuelae]
MVSAIGDGIDLASTEQALENALSFMRNRFRPGPVPGAGGWYHQLDAHTPGPTATAVGLDMFQLVGAPFDHFDECLGFLRERQVRSADSRVDGGWSTNTSLGHPVMEATGWVAYVIGRARTALVTAGPDARSAYQWLVNNQNPDGGWGSLAGCASRVWLTCLGLRALHQLNPYADTINKGLEWLMAARGEEGGWGEVPGRPPTVTHTSFALVTILELRPQWNDTRTIPAFEWLTAHLDTTRLDDRDARVESYNTSIFDGNDTPVVWQTVMPHYGLAFAASALLRHPKGPPAELIADAFKTIRSEQLPSGAWPNVHGGSGESVWSVAPFVNALSDVRRVSPAMPSDLILWAPSLVVIQRADAGDQPLTAIIRAQRRARFLRAFGRHWSVALLSLSALLGLLLVGLGRFSWNDFTLGLILPLGLFVTEQYRNRHSP